MRRTGLHLDPGAGPLRPDLEREVEADAGPVAESAPRRYPVRVPSVAPTSPAKADSHSPWTSQPEGWGRTDVHPDHDEDREPSWSSHSRLPLLRVLPAEERQPRFPIARQTHHGGQFFAYGNTGYSNDHLLYFSATAANLTNPGSDAVVWDFYSPNDEENHSSRHTASSVQWKYTSTGESPSDFKAQSTVQVTVWDRKSPGGRVVSTAKVGTQRNSLSLCAGISARSVGNWRQVSTRAGLATTTNFTISAPDAPATDWARRVNGSYVDATDDAPIAYTNDEWLVHQQTYALPAPRPAKDGNGFRRQRYQVRWDWKSPKPSHNRNIFHSYLTVMARYSFKQGHWKLTKHVYDASSPFGRLLEETEGDGPLDQFTLSYGEGLPQYGTWKFHETIQRKRSPVVHLNVRAIVSKLERPRHSSYVDNGGVAYNLSVQTFPRDWTPTAANWSLVLRSQDGALLKRYSGQQSGDLNGGVDFQQIWDGTDLNNSAVASGTVVQPEFQVSIPKSEVQARVAGIRPLAAQNPSAGRTVINYFISGGVDTDNLSGLIPSPVDLTGCTVDVSKAGLFIGQLGSGRGNLYLYAAGADAPAEPVDTFLGTTLTLTIRDVGYFIPAGVNALRGYSPIYLYKQTSRFPGGGIFTFQTAQRPTDGTTVYNKTLPNGTIQKVELTLLSPGYPTESKLGGWFDTDVFDQFSYTVGAGGTSDIAYDSQTQPSAPLFSIGTRSFHDTEGVFSSAVERATGRYLAGDTDLALRTRGLPLALSRYHWSEGENEGPFWGWAWNFQREIRVSPDHQIYYHTKPDGGVDSFTLDQNGNYGAARADITDKLAFDGRTYTITQKSGRRYLFTLDPNNPQRAYLTQDIDRQGNANTFQWNATATECLRIVGPVAQQYITIGWQKLSGVDVPIKATDYTGRTVTYGYLQGLNGLPVLGTITQPGNKSTYLNYLSERVQGGGFAYRLLTTSLNQSTQTKFAPSDGFVGVLQELTMADQRRLLFQRNAQRGSAQGVPQVTTSITTTPHSGSVLPGGNPQAWSFDLDAAGRVGTSHDPVGNYETYQYDPANNVLNVTSALAQHAFTYDVRNNVTSSRDQLGHTWGFQWDSQDNLITLTDPNSASSLMSYDAHKNLLVAQDPAGHTNRFSYNAAGEILTHTDGNSHTTTYGYNALGFLTSVTMPAVSGVAASWLYTVDNLGRRTRATDPNQHSTSYVYDVRDHLIETTLNAVTAQSLQAALPAVSAFSHYDDTTDLLLDRTDVDGRQTVYTYDDSQRLVSTLEPGDAQPSRMEYDATGNLLKLTLPSGQITSFLYDAKNRVVTANYPTHQENYLYNQLSQITQWTRGPNQVNYEYDVNNRLKHLYCLSTNDDIQLGYDALDRVNSMTDASGTTAYSYTPNYNLETITRPGNRVITYGYDPGERLINVRDPEQGTTAYAYNERNEITSAALDGQTVSYNYDGAGRLTASNYPGGLQCTQSFDERNRLVKKSYARAGNPLLSFAYNFNQEGQRINRRQIDSSGTVDLAYTYDARLSLASSTRGRGAAAVNTNYAFDSNINLTRDGSETLVNQANNLLTNLSGFGLSESFANNGIGQRTAQAGGSQNLSFVYNYNDQIKRVTGSAAVSYVYDGSGNRVSKRFDSGGRTDYLWNGSEVLKEYNGDGSVKAQYLMGLGREGIKTGGKWSFYLNDALDSTYQLVDSTGAVQGQWSYDDWGNTTTISAPARTAYNPYLFQGQQFDAETGFYSMRARYYDPKTARFTSPDPIRLQGGRNMFTAFGGDPTNRMDPTGLEVRFQGYGEDMVNEITTGIKSTPAGLKLWNILNTAPVSVAVVAFFCGGNVCWIMEAPTLLRSFQMTLSDKWRARVREYEASGLTPSEFCSEKSFTQKTLRTWANRFYVQDHPPGFTKLDSPEPAPFDLDAVKPESAPEDGAKFELVLELPMNITVTIRGLRQ